MVNKQLIARYELWRGADISFDLLLNFYTVLPLQVEAEEIDLGFEVKIIHRTSSLDNSIPSWFMK